MSKFSVLLLISIFTTNVIGSCPNDCSNHGYCNSKNQCLCSVGYFGDDCSDALKDTHQTATIILQVVLGVFFFLLFLLSSTAFYYIQKRHATSMALVSNVRSIVFVFMMAVGLTEGFYVSADPWCFYFMPLIANRLIHVASFPIGIITFTSILFHWIELIQTSIKSIKKEQMMQNINVNYKGKEITVEDMVERVKFLRGLKVPFFAFLVVLTLAVFALETARALEPEYNKPLLGAVYGLITLCWGFLLLGFLIYGRRLIKLMPFELAKKVTRLTRKLTILSGFILFCFVIMVPTLVSRKQYDKQFMMTQFVVVEFLIGSICFAICFVFVHWQRYFPFIAFGETHSRSSTAGKTPTVESASYHIELEATEDAS